MSSVTVHWPLASPRTIQCGSTVEFIGAASLSTCSSTVTSRLLAAIAALAWRGGWISIGDVDSRDDWRRLSRFSPLGWLLWSRLDDADERAIALCIELLSVDPAFADAIADASESPLVLPKQMRPYFARRR